jgi:2-polyprenyl-6-methoxyphenol hydroxylase-like FAD-dependent oxidoreductase
LTSIQNALIVGGGIAGLTAATALSRTGISCDVVDLADGPAGAAISLLNRAVDGLAEMGVLDQCLDEGLAVSPQDIFAYFDAAGKPVSTPPMPPAPTSALPHGILIYRPALANILRRAAEGAGASVRNGVGLAGLRQTEDSVTATLTDGSERSYDLVIGADGIRSKTRSLILGDQVTPTYSGLTMFRWVADGVPDVGPIGHYESEHLCVTRRQRDGGLYLATGREFPERPRIDAAQARQIVRENLRSFTAPLMRALEERLTDDTKIIVNDYDWLLVSEPWYRGRILLIGDAAHATTAHLGAGGGMAVEDGVVLGQECAAGGPLEDVFKRFMTRRFERARLVVQTSVELDRMQQRGEPIAAQNKVRGRAMEALSSPY